MKRTRTTLISATTLALLSHAASADTIQVPADLPLPVAVQVAVDGDEIVVAPGTYFTVPAIDLQGKEIHLRSSGGAAVTFIDGLELSGVLLCDSGETANTIIEGFTIQNAGSDFGPDGGGLRCVNSSPTVRDCVFLNNNVTGDGGGVYINNGSPTFTNCEFVSNTADSEGGGLFIVSALVDFTDCTFTNNAAGVHGGAIRTTFAGGTYTRCTFVGNVAGSNGGVIDVNGTPPSGGVLTFRDCVFDDNSCTGVGGAIQLATHGSVQNEWVNCVFRNNSADSHGGAVNALGTGIFTNCTFDGNTSTGGDGGAVFDAPSGVARVRNSILWNNTPNQANAGTDITYSNVQLGFAGTGNVDADPMFVDAGRGDVRLSPGSPSIDAGRTSDLSVLVEFDLDGLPRVLNDPDTPTKTGEPSYGYFIDQGAYEFQAAAGPDDCPSDISPPGGNNLINIDDLLKVISDFGVCP